MPVAFDKEVTRIINGDFAKEFRNFLKHPEDEEACLTTAVSFSSTGD